MTEAGRRALELRLFLERFVAERPDEPLAWVIVPSQASLHTLQLARRLETVPDAPRPRRRALVRASVRAAREEPAPGTGFHTADGFLFEADGVNHLRALQPVMRALGAPASVSVRTRLGRRRVAALSRRSLAVAEELLAGARTEGVRLAHDPAAVRSSWLAGARYLAHAEALVEQLAPKAVVVASTTNMPPRALIRAARAAGIASVFFPHAPVLRDPFYNDLPVDRAGLRGKREAELYDRWGANVRGIEVVGDPSLERGRPAAIDPERPAVFAPPVNPPERLPELFELVHGVLGDAVTVSPHPRADMELVRTLMPDGWGLWEARTAELLEQGPPLIVQHSSGVALEALRLGIPTIELNQPVWPTTYAAIEEPYVHSASTLDELRSAVAAARRDAGDERARAALVEWAHAWSESDERTPARAAALVRTAAAGGTMAGPIWDVWAGDATATEALPRLTGS